MTPESCNIQAVWLTVSPLLFFARHALPSADYTDRRLASFLTPVRDYLSIFWPCSNLLMRI